MTGRASNITEHVDSAFIFIIGVSIVLLALITFMMIWFAIKYNRNKHPKAAGTDRNYLLEALWIFIPTVLVMLMFYYGWTGFKVMRTVPDGAMVVRAEARMWSWNFTYANGKESDILYLPINEPVKILLTSRDVVHSFFIPAFRVKEDAVPGAETYLWFKPAMTGKFDILCAEYCGLRHSYMVSKANVMPENEFRQWYEPKEESVGMKQPMTAAQLLYEHGCLDCHTTDGTAEDAPSFRGLIGRETVVITGEAERTIVVDDEYIKLSILDPEADIVKGFDPIMPPYEDEISEKEMDILIEYLKTVSKGGA